MVQSYLEGPFRTETLSKQRNKLCVKCVIILIKVKIRRQKKETDNNDGVVADEVRPLNKMSSNLQRHSYDIRIGHNHIRLSAFLTDRMYKTLFFH